MKWRDLEKELKEQGFTIESTESQSGESIRITSPSGELTSTHRSMMKRDPLDPPFINSLKKIGYVRGGVSETKQPKRRTPQLFYDQYPRVDPETGEKYLTTGEAAALMGTSPSAVSQAVGRGVMKGVRPGKRGFDLPRFPESEVLRYKENRHKRSPVKTRHVEPQSAAVKVQNAVRRANSALQMFREQLDIIDQEVTEMYEETVDARKKLKKVEGILGRAVDSL